MTSIFAKFAISVAATALALTPSIAVAHSGETYVVCKLNMDGFAPLRSCASTKCEVLMRMPMNTALKANEPYSGNSWRDVEVLGGAYMLPIGPDGWVHDKYLCETDD